MNSYRRAGSPRRGRFSLATSAFRAIKYRIPRFATSTKILIPITRCAIVPRPIIADDGTRLDSPFSSSSPRFHVTRPGFVLVSRRIWLYLIAITSMIISSRISLVIRESYAGSRGDTGPECSPALYHRRGSRRGIGVSRPSWTHLRVVRQKTAIVRDTRRNIIPRLAVPVCVLCAGKICNFSSDPGDTSHTRCRPIIIFRSAYSLCLERIRDL